MAKFHINDRGMVGRCRATSEEGCPFGGEDAHYENMVDARAGFEAQQAEAEVPQQLRKKTLSRVHREQRIQEIRVELHQNRGAIDDHHRAIGRLQRQLRGATDEEVNLLVGEMELHESAMNKLAAARDPLQKEFDQLVGEYAPAATPESTPKPQPPNLDNVVHAAEKATSHAPGQTVLGSRVEDDAVALHMGSWPRAKEVQRALAKEGLITEFAGESGTGGEVVRVYNPATTRRRFIESSSMEYDGKENRFKLDLGDQDFTPEHGLSVVSSVNGEAVRLMPENQWTGEDGNVYRSYRPENTLRDWTVTVRAKK